MLFHPVRFRHYILEAVEDGALPHLCQQLVGLLVPDPTNIGTESENEGGIRLLEAFLNPVVEHSVIELIQNGGPVVPGRDLGFRIAGVKDVRDRHRQFLVRRNRNGRLVVVRNRVDGPGPFRFPVGEFLEVLGDHRLDHLLVKITDGDDCHQVGAVPIAIEASQCFVRTVFEDVLFPDGKALRIAGIMKENRVVLVHDALERSPSEPPFFNDHTPLPVDFVLVKTDRTGPFFQDLERLVDELNGIRRDLKHVDRFIEARVGIDVRAEPDPFFFEKVDDFIFRKTLRAVERHMFAEVGKPLLIVSFKDRSRLDHQAQFRPVLRFRVGLDVVFQTVLECADGNGRIGLEPFTGADGLLGGRGNRKRREKNEYPGQPEEVD